MNSSIIHIHKTDRTPFFYIIQHIPSGKLYAGCKYGIDSNPNTFMVDGGYQTSSKTVARLIQSDGLHSFKIIQILTEIECGIDVLYYETRFLRENHISNRENWLNSYNNQAISFGSPEFYDAIRRVYGVDHPSQAESIKNKKVQTCLSKFGVEYTFQSEEIREKSKQTNLERLGVEYPTQSEEVKQKCKATCNINYGVDHNMQSPIVKNKAKQTNLERLGVEYPTQSEEVKQKCKATWLETLGVDNPTKSPVVKEKMRKNNIKTWGIDNPAKLKFICHECGHVSSMCGLSKHASKCWPKFGKTWERPKSAAEWLELKFDKETQE